MTGQRPHPMVLLVPKDDRGWIDVGASPKVVSGKPVLPTDRSGFRDERLGSPISPRLHTSVEDIIVNVGGPCGEGCSPPVKRMGVGGVIVLGGRESRLHGEGRQGIDVVLAISCLVPPELEVNRLTVKIAEAAMNAMNMTNLASREMEANPRRAGCGESVRRGTRC